MTKRMWIIVIGILVSCVAFSMPVTLTAVHFLNKEGD